jgi:hypothetical protein
MLSGIKTGKKKKSSKPSPPLSSEGTIAGAAAAAAVPPGVKSSGGDDDNVSAAQRLKQALARGLPLPGHAAATESSTNNPTSSYMDRVTQSTTSHADQDPSSFVVLDAPGTTVSRYAGRKEEDMTVTELAAKERAMTESGLSWNEHAARDVVRVGKKRKLKAAAAASLDSDEEVEQMKRHMPDHDIKKSAKQVDKEQQRERRRQISEYQKHEKITSMCSWWINSSSFDKHRLLAFGKHVSLMMAPLNASLLPGHQFYLVPLKHAPSFVDCDDDGVWDEVKLFRTSLEKMYARQGKGIMLVETVLPNKGFWQTKMEVVPVPFSVIQDANIYFKSSMMEQAEEFGTHNKLLKTSIQKPLKSVIPKKFPYFYVDWGNIATYTSTGYAQIVESSNFRHDFGLDTLAGMMELDPIRFQRKRTFPPGMEREAIAEFQTKWSAYDWTKELES